MRNYPFWGATTITTTKQKWMFFFVVVIVLALVLIQSQYLYLLTTTTTTEDYSELYAPVVPTMIIKDAPLIELRKDKDKDKDNHHNHTPVVIKDPNTIIHSNRTTSTTTSTTKKRQIMKTSNNKHPLPPPPPMAPPKMVPKKVVVDVLSLGSQIRPEYQEMQYQTWGSHPSIRTFFVADERIDADPACLTTLTTEDVVAISTFCRDNPTQRRLTTLEKFMKGWYGHAHWLQQKANPVGWLCNIPRPMFAIQAVLDVYRAASSSSSSSIVLPDYLLIVEDETYYHMDEYHARLQTFDPNDPLGFAACLVRTSPRHKVNFTFPHGGFGYTLSRGAMENLMRPLEHNDVRNCSTSTTTDTTTTTTATATTSNITTTTTTTEMEEDSFAQAVCHRLQDPLLHEGPLFQTGMSLMDLMVEHASYQPYSHYRNWTSGFCHHGDWLFGYWFQYYQVTNAVANTTRDARQRIVAHGNPYERTHLWGIRHNSQPPRGSCKHDGGQNKDKHKPPCPLHKTVACHKLTPPTMQETYQRAATTRLLLLRLRAANTTTNTNTTILGNASDAVPEDGRRIIKSHWHPLTRRGG
jgi:hypothetical protein